MILMALQLADYTWSHRRFIIAELFCTLTVETETDCKDHQWLTCHQDKVVPLDGVLRFLRWLGKGKLPQQSL